jgi:hypothetical protein
MRRMNLLGTAVLIWASVMLAGVAPVSAQTAPVPSSPRIFSVVPDLTGTTLVISGLRFGEGTEVWVEGEMLPVNPGATDERLEIDVPPAWRIQPGTYRLVVRTAQGRTDSFEVTVGGAGAWGSIGAGPEGRPVGSPTKAAAAPAVADSQRRAGDRAGAAGAPGGTRPGVVPAVREDPGSPYATAVGEGALAFNAATGTYNTAAGYLALYSNSTGSQNTAAGAWALADNTTGNYNTAAGTWVLWFNTTGTNNTATGNAALQSNTTGSYNTAAGASALYLNTTAWDNTATGYRALYSNTTGSYNTAAGADALFANTTGIFNTATGLAALQSNTTGSDNTAAGFHALLSNTTGNRNVALGYQAGWAQTTGSDNVYVANAGVAGESGRIRIGTAGTHTDTYLAGTVRATAFVGDGAGLTNVTCAGSGGSSVPPAAPDSQAVVSELQELRRTVTAQASQLDAQAQQVKAQALREASQDQLLAALQARLGQLEARQAPSRTGGTR